MGKRRTAHPLHSNPHTTLLTTVVSAELDLHGMRLEEALLRVDGFLDVWRGRQPGAVLRIICGKGNRSEEGPVLLGAVEQRLRANLGGRVEAVALDAGGGAWLVRVMP